MQPTRMRMTGSMTRTRDREPEHLLEVHNHMPSDDDDPQSASEAWAQLRERQDGEGDLPPWFEAYQRETADRFRSMHDAVKALHDRLQGFGRRRVRGDDDETVEDPNMVSGEVEPYERGEDRRHRTHDQPVMTLAALNARNRQLHPRRTTRDEEGDSARPRTLADVNRFMKNWYHAR